MTQCRALAPLSGCVNPVSAGLGFKVEALYKSQQTSAFLHMAFRDPSQSTSSMELCYDFICLH